MKHRKVVLIWIIITLFTCSILEYLPTLEANAQGGLRIQLPFTGIYRINSYIDHETPFSKADNPIKIFNGEEYNNCPSASSQWTTQGPYCYDGHEGIDWAMGTGTHVLAAASGEVVFKGFDTTGYGYTIRISHGNDYQTRYAHLKKFSDTNININIGDQVNAGDVIALSGNSGNSGGPHLHFDVVHNSRVTDPFGWRGDTPDPLINYSGETAVCLWANGWCNETIAEDGDRSNDGTNRFYQYGNGWQWAAIGNSWTMKYVTNGDGSAYARWRPRLDRSGPYELLAFIPASHATTTQAAYRIGDLNGSHTVTINQSQYADEWVSLGAYNFRGNFIDYAQLTNNTGEPAGSAEVAFDNDLTDWNFSSWANGTTNSR